MLAAENVHQPLETVMARKYFARIGLLRKQISSSVEKEGQK